MKPTETTLKRAAVVGLAVLVTVGLGVGPVASFAQENENAQVRVAHMSPDAPAVDVQVDNETVVQDLEYSDVTEYLDLAAGDHSVALVTSENDTEVFSGEISVEADQRYTVVAFGEVSENATEPFQVTVLEDTTEAPTGNESSVRLFHASPDAGPVDVTVNQTGDVLFDDAEFGNATDYATVPSGAYSLDVRVASEDNNGTVVATFNESLLEGNAYTVFAAGYAAPEDAPADEPLSLFVAVDANATADMGTETEMAETETAMGNETTTEA